MAQTKAQLIDGKGAVDLGAFSISGSAPDNSVNLDASGRLLVGTSSDTSAGEASALIQTAYSTGSLMSVGRSDTTVTNNEFIGGIDFVTQSGTGSTWQRSARILCYADADQGNGDSPGRLTFSTTADGASSPTERMRIDNAGVAMFNRTSYRSGVGSNCKFQVTGANGADWTADFSKATSTVANCYGIII